MPDKKNVYNYKNPKFFPLRDPMRAVISAYGKAEKFYAALKEVAWGEFGLKFFSEAVHFLEHAQPDGVDGFSEIMRQYGLEIEYPETPEMKDRPKSIDDLFEKCVELLDQVNAALSGFIHVTNGGEMEPMARQTEQLQIDNSMLRTKLLEAWSMYDETGDAAAFDKWSKSLFKGQLKA